MIVRKFLLRRDLLDNILDFLRFRLDAFPSLDYQPLPWLGIHSARRDVGVWSRWKAIAAVVDDLQVSTALDIGCNAGFFSVSLAMRGVTTVGVEILPKYYRTVLYGSRKLQLEQLGLLCLKVTPVTVAILPEADCVLFLSVWHHLSKEYGLNGATGILRAVWSKTRRVLFFETGEREMPLKYNLPSLEPDAQSYLRRYLEDKCSGGQVRHLGRHEAFSPDGRVVERNLFAVLRG